MRCCSPEPAGRPAQLGEAVARAWQDHDHRCTCHRAGLASTCRSCSGHLHGAAAKCKTDLHFTPPCGSLSAPISPIAFVSLLNKTETVNSGRTGPAEGHIHEGHAGKSLINGWFSRNNRPHSSLAISPVGHGSSFAAGSLAHPAVSDLPPQPARP